jgi:hypothetical protein
MTALEKFAMVTSPLTSYVVKACSYITDSACIRSPRSWNYERLNCIGQAARHRSSIIRKEHQGFNIELVLPSNIASGVIQLSHNNNGDIELQRAGKQRRNENKGIILRRCFPASYIFSNF